MSPEGFRSANVAVGILDDPGFRALIRRLRGDPAAIYRHGFVYLQLHLDSWKAGERLAVNESVPAWDPDDPEPIRENLHAVGLVDDEGRIPADLWAETFGPAEARQRDRQFEGLVGGLMGSLHLNRAEATAEARRRQGQPRGDLGDPGSTLTRQSVRQTDRQTVSKAGAGGPRVNLGEPEATLATTVPAGHDDDTTGAPSALRAAVAALGGIPPEWTTTPSKGNGASSGDPPCFELGRGLWQLHANDRYIRDGVNGCRACELAPSVTP